MNDAEIENLSEADWATINKLRELGFVVVPRVPTEQMLKEAWAAALAEDAAEVWREMIAAGEITAAEIQSQQEAVYLAASKS